MTYIGSGSGYTLCRSAEMSAKIRLNLPANALAAGDLMLNFSHYTKLLKDTVIVAPSRSGSTSEVILAVKKAKEELGVPCISICAVANSELSKIADLNLEIPWAFDESVCQTRTVTNLYTANLMLIGIMADDDVMMEEIKKAIESGNGYMDEYKETLQRISVGNTWSKVVVLADSELQGIAAEGAVAFKEIPQVMSNFYHILDVRHGPMVLIDKDTLVIIATSPYGISYQQDLICDLKKRGALVVTVGAEEAIDSDYHITLPECKNYAVYGIPFIFVPQAIGFYKAVQKGINPDLPNGLDPWIKL